MVERNLLVWRNMWPALLSGVFEPVLFLLVLGVGDRGITERATVTADGRYPSRALVVQGRLWSLFDGGVMVTDFANPAQGTFTGFR